MIKEHDSVILRRDIKASIGEKLINSGTSGAVVSVDIDGNYMVEFFDKAGETIGLARVTPDDIRALTPTEAARK